MAKDIWKSVLDKIKNEGAYRRIQTMGHCEDGHLEYDGKRLLNLCSNDYLGMAMHPEVIDVFKEAVLKWGMGSGAARLLGGTRQSHVKLEKTLALTHNSPASLVFNSGYSANSSVIPALADRFSHILSDRLNHASIIDGIIQSRLSFDRYRHMDMEHLESMLKTQSNPEKTIVISETLFSMEGDFVPLDDIRSLQKKFGFFLYLDEAHSFCGYPDFLKPLYHGGYERTAVMGTLGKAVGCFGAFIVGEQSFIEFLVNKCRGFIFSTSLPPAVMSAAASSINILGKETWRIKKLREISHAAKEIFMENNLKTGNSGSHIIPVIVGKNQTAVDVADKLFEKGIYALPVRPPTVPKGSARIRFSLNCYTAEVDISKTADTVRKVLI